MKYIKKRGTKYHYIRRVPKEIRLIDGREFIQVSLKTDSLSLAEHRATILNQTINDYWEGLIIDPTNKEKKFQEAIYLARLQGFGYKTAAEITQAPLENIVKRIITANTPENTPDKKAAVLGKMNHEPMTLSKALERFWELSEDKQLNKSEGQIQKWKNPRIKAMKNFINIVGDKDLAAITRDDALNFKDWWVNRLYDEDMTPNSANKDFIHLRGVLLTVNDSLRLGYEFKDIFDRLTVKDVGRTSRLSFEPEFVQDTLLSNHLLKSGLSEQLWLFICAMADTGARISELTGLNAEQDDIVLNAPIPFIHIRANENRQLKTPHSERVIPLVGSALFAFEQLLQGFTSYAHRPDSLSSAINKWFRENEVLPTLNHSLYSLRHCFQDRLISIEAPDRVQAELMGHKFHRPRYGAGASLEQKQKWFKQIAFKAPNANRL